MFLPAPPVDNSLLQGFRQYLVQRVSEATARDYVNAVARNEWPPTKRSHIKAWRHYVQYLFSIGRLSWEWRVRYLELLKLPKAGRRTQEEVPVETILEYRRKMEDAGLGDLYVFLLGGTRLKHIVKMLETWAPAERVKHPTDRFEPRLACTDGFCRYYLGVREGSKRTDYVYFPRVASKFSIPRMEYVRLRDKLNKELGVSAGLFRKFANQVLERLAHEHNIRLDAVNLIMSRELSITGEHYLNTVSYTHLTLPTKA